MFWVLKSLEVSFSILLHLSTDFYNSFTNFFRVFCVSAIVYYVFLLAFAWEIGTHLAKTDPLAHARLMTAVLAL